MGSEGTAKCCAAYSFVGSVFLLVLGWFLINDYRYIKIEVEHEPGEEPYGRVEAGYVCLWAAVIYAVILAGCVILIWSKS
jgi:hypothetical protein